MYVRRSIVIAAVMMLFLGLPLISGAEQADQASEKVAKVGNLIITRADVDRRAQVLMPMQGGFHGSVKADKIIEIKKTALDELIVRSYKVQYAIDEELSIDSSVFDAEWQKRLSKNPKLAEYEQTPQVNKIKADIYLDLLARKAESVAVDAKVTVNDDEVAAYYAANKSMYFRPRLYTASHVFVRVDPSDNAEEKAVKRARADALFARAKAGEDFYNLAYYESDDRSKYVGGSLGSFHAGQTVPEFDATIQKMQTGEIAGPIRTMYGFHIVKLDKVDDERQLSFDDVSAKVRARLVEIERKRIYDQWLSDLRAKYLLERFDR